jgi:hypothetical protein
LRELNGSIRQLEPSFGAKCRKWKYRLAVSAGVDSKGVLPVDSIGTYQQRAFIGKVEVTQRAYGAEKERNGSLRSQSASADARGVGAWSDV